MSNPKKIILAYSGGLDTSIILKWLQETYQCDVCTFTADIGQGEELGPAQAKAKDLSAAEIFVEDLREEFVSNFVFPMLRSGAIYEAEYLLGTAVSRPLIAKRLVEIASESGADAIAHGATSKGNDQVRFELSAYALNPDIQIIAPWRIWDLNSRADLLEYAKKHQINIERKSGKPLYSMDANLLHISYEGEDLEDPWQQPDESMWQWTTSPEQSPNTAETIEIEFRYGDPVALNKENLSPAQLLEKLNHIAAMHGIGRIDIVENRYVGMKSRGCYETPGGTVLFKAHRAMESLTLDREVQHLKDELAVKYATLIYNGYWWSDERKLLQTMIDETQKYVSGHIRLKLYKGGIWVNGRKSKHTLFDPKIVTFEDDEGMYDASAATGFIGLNALRLKLTARRK